MNPATKEDVRSLMPAKKYLNQCLADLLKGVFFDDEVMDWVIEALHQSHADQKRFRKEQCSTSSRTE
jgi:hypothetical protein